MLTDIIYPLKNNHIVYENNFFTHIHHEQTPIDKLNSPGIALITFENEAGHDIRMALSALFSHFRNISTYDLGTINDADQKTKIISWCNTAGVVPVFIGHGNKGITSVENNKSNWVISNKIHSEFSACNFIGYQRHLCTHDDIFQAEEYHYNHISLGKMRSNPAILEPCLRDTIHLYFDMRAIRTSEAPNTIDTYPTGLNGEELCQIFRHAGSGGQISAVHIDFNQRGSQINQEAHLIAEAVWYFAEGVNIRIPDHPLKSNDFTSFIIHSPHIDEDLSFIKHNQTGKWWLKHPETSQSRYLACSYEEYHTSIGEDLPERISKFIHSET